jgi:myo-inositol-hexaphosphate 3-phosphohydrolase
MHDLKGKDEFGVCATYINVKIPNRSNIISALKTGNAYGVEFAYSDSDNNDIKAARIKNIPFLKNFTITGDTINIAMSDTVSKFKFIGQSGEILSASGKSINAFYKIKPSDTYIRTEIRLGDSSRIYLNPVFRYSGSKPLEKTLPHERILISVLLKIIIIAFWLIIVYIFVVKPYVKRKR